MYDSADHDAWSIMMILMITKLEVALEKKKNQIALEVGGVYFNKVHQNGR